ncbi:MAG: 2-dehydro-3-deoxygalactonokinase [Rhodobacteraceae bacterium]|nr:2-dehydro-3-deoxygalactonokinase [Paracoccaceae bacterium]
MSESYDTWQAALAGPATLTLWDMPSGRNRRHGARADLAGITHPTVIAGLDVPGVAVPAAPMQPTRHSAENRVLAVIPELVQASPAARSRGAETVIAGYLAMAPGFDGVLLVAGSENLWAHVSAGEVVSFATFLTPRLQDALGAPTPQRPGADFTEAMTATLARPERLAAHLASDAASGAGLGAAHLIGAEIAAAKPYWLGQRLVILGDLPGHAQALRAQGVETGSSDHTAALLAGFRLAFADLSRKG